MEFVRNSTPISSAVIANNSTDSAIVVTARATGFRVAIILINRGSQAIEIGPGETLAAGSGIVIAANGSYMLSDHILYNGAWSARSADGSAGSIKGWEFWR